MGRRDGGAAAGARGPMTEPMIVAVTAVAAVGTGLTAGVYLAFAVLVMPALAAAPPAPALAAMQRINELAQRPVFGVVFFAAALGSGGVVAAQWLSAAAGPWPSVGALLSLAAFLVTVSVNVPGNRRMARLDAGSADDLTTWRMLAGRWQRANRVRAGCATLALLAFVV